jgi:hypothetical protein
LFFQAESWVKDINSLVESSDHGVDEITANALLNRHREVCQQVNIYYSKSKRRFLLPILLVVEKA